MTIILGVLVLGVLIFVHEFGHFLLAKMNGVGVLEFAIGFGKPLWQIQRGETVYSLRAIPLGGYVRMVGDDIHQVSGEMEEADYDFEESEGEENAAQMQVLRDRSRWFLEKGFFAKSAIVIAGPAFNVLFAAFLSILSVYVFGLAQRVDKPIVGDVLRGYPAERAGVLREDRVRQINGTVIETWADLRSIVQASKGEELTFLIERKNKDTAAIEEVSLSFAGTTDTSELDALEGREPDGKVRIGIVPWADPQPVGFGKAVQAGLYHTWYTSVMVVRGVKAMLTRKVSAEHISGPIGIFNEVSKSAERGMEYLLSITIFLSISLAILNLLPIPILDGGHLLFFVIELVKGGRVSLRVHELANQVGMMILLLLMVFAVGNDLRRLIFPL